MDGKCSRLLLPVELTSSGRPVLQPGEIECSILDSVDIESEENPNPNISSSSSSSSKPGGLLILTTHRLLWIIENSSSSSGSSIPLSAVIHVFPPKKSIKNMFFSSPRLRIQVSVSSEGRVSERGSRSVVITLVMRGKTDPESFINRFWEVLKSRSWEETASSESGGGGGGGSGSVAIRMPVVGVSGILRKEQELWESTDKSLHDAFQDLNALMSKAKEMVMLAEKMRLKLLSGSTVNTTAANEDEMGSKQEMQDWLLSVGIASPVTKETAGALYHQQLCRQLADFVKVPLERAGGMISLIDVYCLFNRARGTELISPEDLLQACAIWEKFDVPVMLRKFDSGVMVIQSKAHSDEEVFMRIKSLVVMPDALRMGISASDAARTLGVAPALAKEHLLTAESKGLLCRDVSPEGFRFYVNLFTEIDSNNIYTDKRDGLFGNWVSATSIIS